MRKQNFSIKFFLYTAKESEKKGTPIYLRIIVDRKKVELSTNLYLKKTDKWNEETQRINKNPIINHRLSAIETDLYNIIKELEVKQKKISSQLIKNIYCEAGTSKKELKQYIKYYLEKFVLSNSAFSLGTQKNYRVTANHIEHFLEATNQPKILLVEVDAKFISDFEVYLRNKAKGLSISSIGNHHKRLTTIFKKAILENELEKNPYFGKKIGH